MALTSNSGTGESGHGTIIVSLILVKTLLGGCVKSDAGLGAGTGAFHHIHGGQGSTRES